MTEEKSIGEQNYEQFADRYDQKTPTKPHNAYYERPATLSLLPDVNGMKVLDAGCGPGHYADWLIQHGAQVTAFDVTPDFVKITRNRVGGKATVLRHDLNKPLNFADSDSFDLVLCPLVLDYIEDWRSVFKEFSRVLKTGGIFIYSASHPAFDHYETYPEGNYFDIEFHEMEWGGFGEPRPTIKSYRRSLMDFLNPLIEAGMRLDYLLEPKPTKEFQEIEPEEYAELMQKPGFLCIRAIKG